MLCDEEGDVMWVSTCFLLKKFKKYILQVIFFNVLNDFDLLISKINFKN
jgi:hypothetical protein